MSLLRTVAYNGNPYPVAITETPCASMLDGHAGAIPVGASIGVYWTQLAVGGDQVIGAQPVVEGRLAIAYGAATPGDVANLMIAGVVDCTAALSTAVAVGVNVTRDVPIGHAIPAGVDLWAVWVASPADPANPPRLDGVGLLDRTASGAAMVAAAGASIEVGQLVTFTPRRGYDARLVSASVTMP